MQENYAAFGVFFKIFFKFWLLKVEVFTSKPYIIQIYMQSKQSYNFLSLKEQNWLKIGRFG